jgi:hypothetical protein
MKGNIPVRIRGYSKFFCAGQGFLMLKEKIEKADRENGPPTL